MPVRRPTCHVGGLRSDMSVSDGSPITPVGLQMVSDNNNFVDTVTLGYQCHASDIDYEITLRLRVLRILSILLSTLCKISREMHPLLSPSPFHFVKESRVKFS